MKELKIFKDIIKELRLYLLLEQSSREFGKRKIARL